MIDRDDFQYNSQQGKINSFIIVHRFLLTLLVLQRLWTLQSVHHVHLHAVFIDLMQVTKTSQLMTTTDWMCIFHYLIMLLYTWANDLEQCSRNVCYYQAYCLHTLAPSVQPAVELYSAFVDEQQVCHEFELWKRQWASETAESKKPINLAVLALERCSAITYPNLHILLQIMATLPVTTAQPERVFSKVERTASAARAAMTECRLESLVLIQAHRDKTPTIDVVIDRFAMSNRRFVIFALYVC